MPTDPLSQHWQNIIQRIDERIAVPAECRFIKVAHANHPYDHYIPWGLEMRLYNPDGQQIHPHRPGFVLEDLRPDLVAIFDSYDYDTEGVFEFDLQLRTCIYVGSAHMTRPELRAEWD